MSDLLRRLHEDEGGHMTPLLTTVLGAPGVAVLTAGIVGDWDVVTIIGGAAVAVALVIGGVFRHIEVDYDVMERLSELEG